jgi:hypothetical protein
MINILKDGLKIISWLFLVALLSTNHKCTHLCLLLLRSKRCDDVKLLKMMMLGVRSPQPIACGVGASISRIELYNSDRIVSLFMFFT